MARQKHFRLPDDVLERINHRDKEMYIVLFQVMQRKKNFMENQIS